LTIERRIPIGISPLRPKKKKEKEKKRDIKHSVLKNTLNTHTNHVGPHGKNPNPSDIWHIIIILGGAMGFSLSLSLSYNIWMEEDLFLLLFGVFFLGLCE
jgi:hypothetical protein